MRLTIMDKDRRPAMMALAVSLIGATAFAQAGSPPTTSSAAVERERNPAPPFVPKDFTVPTLVTAEGFTLVPLGPDVVRIDYAAYMSSIDHLQKTFSRSAAWPHAGISDADAMRDMENEQARFRKRASFAYAVLTSDGRHERGSVYVSPSPVPGYDAVVRLWVTKAEYDAGFDAELFEWVKIWIARDWPFERVAYPGRSIPWDEWDPRVAAAKAARAKAAAAGDPQP